MQPIHLRSFKQKARHRKKGMRAFLTRLEKNPPRKLDELTKRVDAEVWQETDCLTCANCCKTMSPTYTLKDIRRIAEHLNMTPKAFKDKWLYQESDGDWMNRSQPCQFLDLKTNMCSIYEVRPADCAGFPHLAKRKMVEYMHVHKQNVEFCPATFKMVEKMQVVVKQLS